MWNYIALQVITGALAMNQANELESRFSEDQPIYNDPISFAIWNWLWDICEFQAAENLMSLGFIEHLFDLRVDKVVIF